MAPGCAQSIHAQGEAAPRLQSFAQMCAGSGTGSDRMFSVNVACDRLERTDYRLWVAHSSGLVLTSSSGRIGPSSCDRRPPAIRDEAVDVATWPHQEGHGQADAQRVVRALRHAQQGPQVVLGEWGDLQREADRNAKPDLIKARPAFGMAPLLLSCLDRRRPSATACSVVCSVVMITS